MKRLLVATILLTSCATAGHPLFPGHYAVAIERTNAQSIVPLDDPEDLEATLRAAFVSRFENIDFLGGSADAYDAVISVRLNFQRVRNIRTIGLEYTSPTRAERSRVGSFR